MRTDLFAAAWIAALAAAPIAQAAPSAAELEAGGNLFIITCSSSFCHGEGGVGARGPSLRNRNFPPDFVRNTMLNGRSGTPMPSFKDSLNPAEVALIVNYVMTLSPENHQEDAGAASAESVAAAPLSDQAERGFEIFFDGTRQAGCALCHSYGGKGGPIGPDLSKIADRTPSAIYQSIVKPSAAGEAYAAVTVTTKDGRKVTGVTRERTDKQVEIFDLSSTPPVLRSFYTADGIKIEAFGTAPLYKHELNGYSENDIADLVAFLKSAGKGEPKPVSAPDLGLK